MKRTKNALKIIALLPCIFFLLSCNNRLGDDDTSSSILILTRITGEDIEGNEVDFLESDVVIGGAVISNSASATLEAKLKNPELLVPGISYQNSIMVNRYEVTYMRTFEGGGTEGVGVPYSFEGTLSAVIEIDATVDISFIIVRAAAKLDRPLVDLLGSLNVLQIVAKVDFFGRDLAGNKVQATGYLTIYFADYIDS